jgi:UBX domain-containing protein 1
MAELNKGLIPNQLRQKYPKGGLSISLADHTSEKYTPPPPPPYVAFSGGGVSLGGESSSKPKAVKKKGENFMLEPDRQREITTMQVRLADGQRIPLEANLDTSLHDIYNHIATISGTPHFDLFGGFPPKALDLDSTVEKSDLADSTLIQKV